MRRRRLTRDQKLAVSAVAAGLLLAAGHGHGGPGTPSRGSTGSGSSNEQLANSMAASGYGWTGRQTTCLDELWTEESGFSATAYNSSSGATGIPQLLPSVHALPANWSDPAWQSAGAWPTSMTATARRAPPGPSSGPTSRTGIKPRPEGGP